MGARRSQVKPTHATKLEEKPQKTGERHPQGFLFQSRMVNSGKPGRLSEASKAPKEDMPLQDANIARTSDGSRQEKGAATPKRLNGRSLSFQTPLTPMSPVHASVTPRTPLAAIDSAVSKKLFSKSSPGSPNELVKSPNMTRFEPRSPDLCKTPAQPILSMESSLFSLDGGSRASGGEATPPTPELMPFQSRIAKMALMDQENGDTDKRGGEFLDFQSSMSGFLSPYRVNPATADQLTAANGEAPAGDRGQHSEEADQIGKDADEGEKARTAGREGLPEGSVADLNFTSAARQAAGIRGSHGGPGQVSLAGSPVTAGQLAQQAAAPHSARPKSDPSKPGSRLLRTAVTLVLAMVLMTAVPLLLDSTGRMPAGSLGSAQQLAFLEKRWHTSKLSKIVSAASGSTKALWGAKHVKNGGASYIPSWGWSAKGLGQKFCRSTPSLLSRGKAGLAHIIEWIEQAHWSMPNDRPSSQSDSLLDALTASMWDSDATEDDSRTKALEEGDLLDSWLPTVPPPEAFAQAVQEAKGSGDCQVSAEHDSLGGAGLAQTLSRKGEGVEPNSDSRTPLAEESIVVVANKAYSESGDDGREIAMAASTQTSGVEESEVESDVALTGKEAESSLVSSVGSSKEEEETESDSVPETCPAVSGPNAESREEVVGTSEILEAEGGSSTVGANSKQGGVELLVARIEGREGGTFSEGRSKALCSEAEHSEVYSDHPSAKSTEAAMTIEEEQESKQLVEGERSNKGNEREEAFDGSHSHTPEKSLHQSQVAGGVEAGSEAGLGGTGKVRSAGAGSCTLDTKVQASALLSLPHWFIGSGHSLPPLSALFQISPSSALHSVASELFQSILSLISNVGSTALKVAIDLAQLAGAVFDSRQVDPLASGGLALVLVVATLVLGLRKMTRRQEPITKSQVAVDDFESAIVTSCGSSEGGGAMEGTSGRRVTTGSDWTPGSPGEPASEYGSFVEYQRTISVEGGAERLVLTPVRRSNRIRKSQTPVRQGEALSSWATPGTPPLARFHFSPPGHKFVPIR